jgi:hypothetical protein
MECDSGDIVERFRSLEKFHTWFEWYKKWLDHGDILIEIPECELCREEQSQEIMKEQVSKKVLKPNPKK